MPLVRPELVANRDFVRFWTGQSVSFVGTGITELALPLTAVVVLGAGPEDVGLLSALGYAPYLVLGLVAGVWVDRFRRRPILLIADLINGVALGSIAVAGALGILRFEQLLVVALVTGSTLVVWNVAYQAYVPSLVERQRIVDANAALETSASIASVVGPALGGLLVQLLTAPVAILVDGFSYAFSAACLATIRAPEPAPIPHEARTGVRGQIVEGLAFVARQPLLRGILACGTIHNFFSRMIDALFVLYAVTLLRLDPVTIGLVVACAGPGAVAGALLSNRLPSRIGLGRTLIAAQLVTGISRVLVPLAAGPVIVAAAILGLSEFLLGFARPIFNVNQLSLRQSITPDRMQGRVNATMRFFLWGVTPVGAFLGGLIASLVGVREVLLVGGVGVLLAAIPLGMTPVGGLASHADAPEFDRVSPA